MVRYELREMRDHGYKRHQKGCSGSLKTIPTWPKSLLGWTRVGWIGIILLLVHISEGGSSYGPKRSREGDGDVPTISIASPDLGVLSRNSHSRFEVRFGQYLETRKKSMKLRIENYSPMLRMADVILNNHLGNSDVDIYILDSVLAHKYRAHFIDLSEYLRSEFHEDFRRFPIFDSEFFNDHGSYMFVPYCCDIGALYYRKDLFSKYNIAKKPPYSSYEQLSTVADYIRRLELGLPNFTFTGETDSHKQDQKLKRKRKRLTTSGEKSSKDDDDDVDHGLEGIMYEGKQDDGLACVAMEWIHAHDGGPIVTDDRQVTLHSDQVVDALLEAASWAERGITPRTIIDYDEFRLMNDFTNRKTVFMRNWARFAGQLAYSNNMTDFGITILPKGKGMINGWVVAIPKTSQQIDYALEIIRFLLLPDIQRINAMKYGLMPVRSSVLRELCTNDTLQKPWINCAVFDGVVESFIQRPLKGTDHMYISISKELSVYLVHQLLVTRWTSASLRGSLHDLSQTVRGILQKAAVGEYCGKTNASNYIECGQNSICLDGVCVVDGHQRTIVIAFTTAFGCLFIFLVGCTVTLYARRDLRMRLFKFLPGSPHFWGQDYYRLKDYRIPFMDIDILEEIGRGSFGIVYKARYRGTIVAMKKLIEQKRESETLKMLESETKLLCTLRHPNVILFMGACLEMPNLAIITEYLPRGSLFSVLHNPNIHMNGKMRMNMLKDIMRGMAFLHSATPPMIHRDLKSPNILVDIDFRLKVSDFGLSGLKEQDNLDEKDNKMIGSVFWTAPEVICGSIADQKSDVYSFGIICWEILTRATLYAELHPLSAAYLVVARDLRPSVPESCAEPLGFMMMACWHSKAHMRPSFSELMAEMESWQLPTNAYIASYQKDEHDLRKPFDDDSEQAVLPPSGQVILVFCDIRRSKEIYSRIPLVMRDCLAIYIDVLRHALYECGGYEVRSDEDNYIIAFQQVQMAVRWAMQVQLDLLKANWPEDLLQILLASERRGKKGELLFRGLRARMAIHTAILNNRGDIEANVNAYFGPLVLKASQICSIAEDGQILLSKAAYNEMYGLWDDLKEWHPVVKQCSKPESALNDFDEALYHVLPASLDGREFKKLHFSKLNTHIV